MKEREKSEIFNFLLSLSNSSGEHQSFKKKKFVAFLWKEGEKGLRRIKSTAWIRRRMMIRPLDIRS